MLAMATEGRWWYYSLLIPLLDRVRTVFCKVSRVSLNVYPMWLIFTYTRPQERYGRISQYTKLIQSFPIIFFVFPSLVTRDTALKRPLKGLFNAVSLVTKLVLLPSISIVDFFFVFVPELYRRFKMYLWVC